MKRNTCKDRRNNYGISIDTQAAELADLRERLVRFETRLAIPAATHTALAAIHLRRLIYINY